MGTWSQPRSMHLKVSGYYYGALVAFASEATALSELI